MGFATKEKEMRGRILILCGVFLLVFTSATFASWEKKPRIRWEQIYHYDLREPDHELYTNRISLAFNYLGAEQNLLFRITPFFEIRRNIDKDLWQRKELGAEIGKDIFPWLYLGQAFQKGWMKEDYRYRADYAKRDYAESETRLLFSHNLLSAKYLKLKGFVLNEYTYDFDRGKGARNEAAIGLIVPIGKYIETTINWRHIDRIHYYDSDTFEGAATLVF